jgi:hypothetical protein
MVRIECKLVADLRKYGVIEPLSDDYSIIYDKRLKDDCGWLIPNESNKLFLFLSIYPYICIL